ncbi:DNA-protecting protein DprA [Eikenella sp. S3360]|uniref:DNA-protecting protein DprA n=1 Tax=Eikenella glucosivorans TaxID=2766967 RepID=A0ABS0NCE1_9NEIS|nr:DNA-processing protein DprA [Eikenella glucosivorans]MBH5329972.1 DNA-protecting protein DprA [Eikenella glucosivorans]
MENTAERSAWLRLALMPHIGAETFYELCRHYGSASAVWAAEEEVAAVLPTRPAQEAWRSRQHEAEAAAEAALEWAEQENCRLLFACDKDFPVQLGEGITPPPVLFARGSTEWLHRPAVAIVGSRHATPQAMRIAGEFGEALAEAGIVTVSGMAAGIDSAAHEGALRKSGGTVAVWGTGIDRVYPVANKSLAHRIAEAGCILSEFPLGTRPLAGNFPRRNRLIAALSSAVLVVEAALESGSLITARLAVEMGRDVFAVPGSIDNPHSKGCHALIKQGAKLTETLVDILEECPLLQEAVPAKPKTAAKPAAQRLPENERSEFLRSKNERSEFRQNERSEFLRSKNEQHEFPPSPNGQNGFSGSPNERSGLPANGPHTEAPLLRAMGYDAIHPDTLAQTLGIPAADVYAELTLLEIHGEVAPLAGGRYQRISPNRTRK